MREIDEIILHCSWSDVVAHDNAKTIDRWHKARGWRGIGYHFVIVKSGLIELGRPLIEVGAHAKGRNFYSIGICLTGKKSFSDKQLSTAKILIKILLSAFDLDKSNVLGHYEINNNKTCPMIDMDWFRNQL